MPLRCTSHSYTYFSTFKNLILFFCFYFLGFPNDGHICFWWYLTSQNICSVQGSEDALLLRLCSAPDHQVCSKLLFWYSRISQECLRDQTEPGISSRSCPVCDQTPVVSSKGLNSDYTDFKMCTSFFLMWRIIHSS